MGKLANEAGDECERKGTDLARNARCHLQAEMLWWCERCEPKPKGGRMFAGAHTFGGEETSGDRVRLAVANGTGTA